MLRAAHLQLHIGVPACRKAGGATLKKPTTTTTTTTTKTNKQKNEKQQALALRLGP